MDTQVESRSRAPYVARLITMKDGQEKTTYTARCDTCKIPKYFSTSGSLSLHNNSVHAAAVDKVPKWKCTVPTCSDVDQTWTRFEQYAHHMRESHGQTDTLKLWDAKKSADLDVHAGNALQNETSLVSMEQRAGQALEQNPEIDAEILSSYERRQVPWNGGGLGTTGFGQLRLPDQPAQRPVQLLPIHHYDDQHDYSKFSDYPTQPQRREPSKESSWSFVGAMTNRTSSKESHWSFVGSAQGRTSSKESQWSVIDSLQQLERDAEDNTSKLRLAWDEADLYLTEPQIGSKLKITEPTRPYEFGGMEEDEEEEEEEDAAIDPRFVTVEEVELAKTKKSALSLRPTTTIVKIQRGQGNTYGGAVVHGGQLQNGDVYLTQNFYGPVHFLPAP